MLKKNNFIIIAITILITFCFVSCDTYVEEQGFGVAFYLMNKDNINSDIIKIHRYENLIDTNQTETIEALEKVVCSLRNDSIDGGKILLKEISKEDGRISFGFSNNKNSKWNTFYIEDLAKEIEAINNGTSKFYIVVNDPDLSGYDELYETKIISCNGCEEIPRIELGRKE